MATFSPNAPLDPKTGKPYQVIADPPFPGATNPGWSAGRPTPAPGRPNMRPQPVPVPKPVVGRPNMRAQPVAPLPVSARMNSAGETGPVPVKGIVNSLWKR